MRFALSGSRRACLSVSSLSRWNTHSCTYLGNHSTSFILNSPSKGQCSPSAPKVLVIPTRVDESLGRF